MVPETDKRCEGERERELINHFLCGKWGPCGRFRVSRGYAPRLCVVVLVLGLCLFRIFRPDCNLRERGREGEEIMGRGFFARRGS